MLNYIIKINCENYVSDGGLTNDYFQAKMFDSNGLNAWLNKRLTTHKNLFKSNSLKDTNIEIMLVEA